LKGANFESNDQSNRTPLSQAVGNGHEEVVKLLIKEGANFQSKNGHETVMRLLVEKKGHEVLVKLLIEKGANLESDDRREMYLERGILPIYKLFTTTDIMPWHPTQRQQNDTYPRLICRYVVISCCKFLEIWWLA